MTGKLAEVTPVFEMGNTYKFDKEQFRGTRDGYCNN